ncbi:aminotransferase class I/II-fold pyridoxal phosphate-dependent enzyme [Streptomyces albofaciens JCM 4342]|uniref:aminotransferase class I/II-fold pyridoxal phosphate-dependent enzyme n=1 Tax=Streptomyces albofaciens TaxID=66866 RepID=UPI001238E825|nr:aminotransferase class I/II-fold pyridoxal phosphate-dependent enzyme [Streptomyces albofaciens]KAA6223345.1 aminotransferase class I/II-fold pyridoxal phosphate-dependent enzyme [Streptomyces albofaciens JCM 4342]
MLGEYRIEGRRASEIAASVERAIGAGELQPGEVLPPMRQLAVYLEVNPNTVASAYRTLRDRGVIETAGRRGSRVRPRPASTPREAALGPVPPGVRDASDGNPDPALLPALGQALAAAAARSARHPTLYGAPTVGTELERMARAAFEADGVPSGAIAVTSGALDAVERVLGAHLRPGDAVAVEDPGWGSLLDLIPGLGLRVVPVAVDDDGPLPEQVSRAVREGARALVVTDRAQNPTGAVLGAGRSQELREVLADHRDVLLIEDDHGHDIVDLPLHPLAGATDHWALVRSTAKAYGPDLRLAVLTGDAVTVDRVRGRQRLGPGWVSHLLQDAVVHLWRTGAVDPKAVADAYGRRRDALMDALAARGVRARGRSGMNVWIPVPDETGAVARLLHAGWAVAPGARFRLHSPPGIRVTIAGLAEHELPALADAIATAVAPKEARRYD